MIESRHGVDQPELVNTLIGNARIIWIDTALVGPTQELLGRLQPHLMCDYDETQNIGKRYRRQDELGTPLCITYDFDSIEDHAVTVRDRDTMEQERVPLDAVVDHVLARLAL